MSTLRSATDLADVERQAEQNWSRAQELSSELAQNFTELTTRHAVLIEERSALLPHIHDWDGSDTATTANRLELGMRDHLNAEQARAAAEAAVTCAEKHSNDVEQGRSGTAGRSIDLLSDHGIPALRPARPDRSGGDCPSVVGAAPCSLERCRRGPALVHVAAQAGQPQDREDNEGDAVRRELAPPRTDPVQMAPDEAGDQVQGRGVRSTTSLASLRPVPVVARYRLIAWILRPGPVRPVGNARGVEEHDEDDKRQCCDSLGREPSSVAFALSGNVCTNLSARAETRKRHAG
ncbi:hypothetical protein [Streptomyces nojiriensis]|uniref:hypothetical protein n=1 Tax=Streptomyces nojiriensis TaxID=66374 RepID=UPI001E2B51FE|nr:hypothetical protein [Streptomyces nojiriensis]